jgi:hypothetical protein
MAHVWCGVDVEYGGRHVVRLLGREGGCHERSECCRPGPARNWYLTTDATDSARSSEQEEGSRLLRRNCHWYFARNKAQNLEHFLLPGCRSQSSFPKHGPPRLWVFSLTGFLSAVEPPQHSDILDTEQHPSRAPRNKCHCRRPA